MPDMRQEPITSIAVSCTATPGCSAETPCAACRAILGDANERLAALAARRHSYDGPDCRHPDCYPEPQGYQAACCGHYYPRARVLIDADSEPYCRAGMGCQARRPARP